MVKGSIRFIVVLLAAMMLMVVSETRTALAGTCISTRVRPVVEGGGSVTDRNYFLDVYGTTNGSGRLFVRWGRMWIDTGFSAVSLTPNGRGVRFGVHTWWAYAHLNLWRSYRYRYEYPC